MWRVGVFGLEEKWIEEEICLRKLIMQKTGRNLNAAHKWRFPTWLQHLKNRVARFLLLFLVLKTSFRIISFTVDSSVCMHFSASFELDRVILTMITIADDGGDSSFAANESAFNQCERIHSMFIRAFLIRSKSTYSCAHAEDNAKRTSSPNALLFYEEMIRQW